MYKVFNMGHRMEFYVPSEIAQEIINISKEFNVDAQIIGRVEDSETKQVTIRSSYGEFIYH
jgi:phosphoribosylformylglycinamidine cyclo-ligase